jgi:Zn-dependent M28 family amino/carboxypeptidase
MISPFGENEKDFKQCKGKRAGKVVLLGPMRDVPAVDKPFAPLKNLGVTTITMRNTGGTDHLSFDAVGIPGFQFIQEDIDYESRTHHTNQDVYERLQPADLKQIAAVETIFLYNAAQRDQMLPRKPLPDTAAERIKLSPLQGIFPGAVPPPAPEKQ